MTDRAKKISELQTTAAVANTDKIVVLKDAANTTLAATKAMTVNSFAQSIAPLLELPGAVVVKGSVTIPSNGTSYVDFFTFDGTTYKSGEIRVHADDATDHNYTMGHLYFVKSDTEANCQILITYMGVNPIIIDSNPTINVTSGSTSFQFRRNDVSTSNVSLRYVAVLH